MYKLSRDRHPLVFEALHPAYNSYSSQLINLYQEKHRYYHNFDHIERILAFMIIKKGAIVHHQIMFALFHDAVYYPQSQLNEELSAMLFRDFVCNNELTFTSAAMRDVECIYSTILATKDHTNVKYDDFEIWQQELLDADLIGLADSEDAYFTTSCKIYKEYIPLYTAAEFQAGRIKFIHKFLDAPRIFRVFTEYEERARFNLARELHHLYKGALSYENFLGKYQNKPEDKTNASEEIRS